MSSGDDCYSRPEIHQSYVSYLPSPRASFQSLWFYRSNARRWGKCGSSAGSEGDQPNLSEGGTAS
jgi:hypothetical protein